MSRDLVTCPFIMEGCDAPSVTACAQSNGSLGQDLVSALCSGAPGVFWQMDSLMQLASLDACAIEPLTLCQAS